MIQQQVRWGDAEIAMVDEVLAMGLSPEAARAEIAARIGVPYVSDNQLRNAYARRGRKLSWRTAPLSQPTGRPPRHDDRDTATSDGPPTQRSQRAHCSTLPPPDAQSATPPQWKSGPEEMACRQWVAPREQSTMCDERKTGVRRALVMSDLHVPHVSRVALDLAKQVAQDVRPDTVIIDGDFLDAAALSSYAKNPRGTASMEEEFAAGNELLDDIDREWGFDHKYHVGGNHLSGRWQRYMWERAPALTGLVCFQDLLRFGERGWKHVEYKDHLFFGSALISHEIGRGGATAMARTRDDIHNDVVIGHVHRAGIHWRGDVMGRTFFGASFGWMGDLAAVDYAHRVSVATTHVLGFGLLTLDCETGQTYAEAVPIIDGRCVAHGKLYKSRVPVPKATKRAA